MQVPTSCWYGVYTGIQAAKLLICLQVKFLVIIYFVLGSDPDCFHAPSIQVMLLGIHQFLRLDLALAVLLD